MASSDVFGEGDSVWVAYWKQKIQSPILVETRFDIISLHNIDAGLGSFHAKVLLYMRVPVDSLGISLADRIPQPGAKCYIRDGDRKIMEWTPWPEVSGRLDNKWAWVRADTRGTPRGDCLIHAMELDGEFRLSEEGGWYPFDFHELRIQLTSNWDEDKLVFIPWGDEEVSWDAETALIPLERGANNGVKMVDYRTARLRTEEVRVTLRNRWDWAPTPMLEFGASSGFNRYKYSQVQVTVLVLRHVLLHTMYELLRPLVLALLAPLSLYFFDDEGGRLEFSATVLVAMSLAFLRGKAERVSFSDYYKLAMFVSASITLVFTTFTKFFDGIDRDNLRIGAWMVLLVMHLPFILGLVYQMPRRKLMKTFYRDTNGNSIEPVTRKMVRGASGGRGPSAVSIKVDK